MQPTPYAQRMAGPVAAALSHLEQALTPPQPFMPADSRRRFNIAMTDVGEVYFMPRLIELCGALAPGVEIASVRAATGDQRAGLRAEMEAGRIDLAIGAFDDAPGALYQRRLFRQEYVSLFRAGHPLADGPLTMKRFTTARHLVVAALESPYDRINTALQKAGILASASFSVPHFSAAPYIVGATDLVVTVPRKLAERAAAPFGLVFVKSPLRLAALQTNVFWHRRYNQDEGNRWLRTLVVDAFGEPAGSGQPGARPFP
jgi:DNA-binding transcriptional LysR family regulator